LHVTVLTADGRILFESGKLHVDGSIEGKVNDTDPVRYLPHFAKIDSLDQFVNYCEQAAPNSAVALARAEATGTQP
jgi:hypothetical protein